MREKRTISEMHTPAPRSRRAGRVVVMTVMLSAMSVHAADSAPFLLDTVTTSSTQTVDSISVSWDASWVGGDAGATVVIADNGTEVKRTTGAGEFVYVPNLGLHELTYTAYIGGVAQDEVYTATFKKVKALTTAMVGAVPDVVYTGSAHRPEPEVTDTERGVTLVKGTDYTISYADNINIGTNTAKVIVTGKGNYSNVVTNFFSILPPPEICNVTARQRWPWNGKVDIDFDVVGDVTLGLPEETYVSLLIAATNRVDGTNYVASIAALSGDTGTAAGAHRVTWDLNAQGLKIKSDDVVFKVEYQWYHRYCEIDLSGGVNATSYPVSFVSSVPSGGFNIDEYKMTKLVLRLVEPGSFKMCGEYDVTLTKSFYCGVFEVTQKQYGLVTGSDPSSYKGDMRPVEQVSWNTIRGNSSTYNWPCSTNVDSNSFIGRLQARTGLHLDLPTEAQWEYACRAGTTSAYNNGGNTENDLKQLGRYSGNKSDGKGGYSEHTKVGSYEPNAWGLYDMHGNVWEWCLDWRGSLPSGVTDPLGSSSGELRVDRGGSWRIEAVFCSPSSDRRSYNPSNGSDTLGFRLVRTLSAAESGTILCTCDSDSVKLDLAEGPRASLGDETLTYSSLWDGGDGATVTIAQDGAALVQNLTGEGEREWSVARNGTYVLTHTTYTNGVAGKVATATFIVTGKDIPFPATDVTVSNYSNMYDGAAHGIGVTVAGGIAGAVVKYATAVNSEFTATVPTLTDVGSMTVWCEVSAPGYITQTNSATVTITKRVVSLTSGSASKTYDGTALTKHEVSVGGDGFVSGEGATYSYVGSQTAVGSSANGFVYVLKDNTKVGNYTITTQNGTLTVTKASNAWTTEPSIAGWTYGQAANAPDMGAAQFGNVQVAYSATPQNAGSYTATFTVPETANYAGLTKVVPFTIAKATYDMGNARWSSGTFTYDGTEKSVIVEGLPSGVTVLSYANNAKTAAGNYTATVALNYDTTNFNAPTMSGCSWSIAKKNIADATVTLGPTLVYNGAEQTQAVTGVKVDGLDSTYTVSGNKGTDVGAYTLTVTGTGNFTGTATKQWQIRPDGIIDAVAPYDGIYDGEGHGIEVSVTKPSSGATVKYALDASGPYVEDAILFTNVTEGAIAVWYTVEAENYASATNFGTVTISPKTLTEAMVAVEEVAYVYDGAAKMPTVTVADGDPSIITEGDYDVAYSDNVAAGTDTATVTVTGKDNYTGTVTKHFSIAKAEVELPAVAGKTYTGGLLKADVSSTARYTVANDGGVNVGSYPVTLTLTDATNYRWKDGDSNPLNLTFSITKASNSWTTQPSIAGWTYGQAANAPNLGAAKFGAASVAYSATPQNAGSYTATFTVPETANYAGLTKVVPFTIAKATYDMTGARWSSGSFTYDGTEKSVIVEGLPSGVTVRSYANNAKTAAGNYTATVTLNYDTTNFNASTMSGCSWSIAKKNIAGATVTLGPTLVFNGTEQTQAVTGVKIDGLNATYTVSDNKGTDVGSYTLTVTGAGNFTGTATREWQIRPDGIVETVTSYDGIYDGAGHGIDVVVTKPTSGAVVKYADTAGGPYAEDAILFTNVTEGAIAVWYTVEAENYTTITNSGTVKIAPKTLTDAMVTVEDANYIYDGIAKTPTVTVADGNPSILTEDDYEVAYSDNVNVGTDTATVTVSGEGNYTGTVTKHFSIKSSEGSKLEDIFEDLPADIEPDGESGWTVTITNDIDSADLPIEIPDNLGHVTIDLKGRDLIGADGANGDDATPGGDGKSAIRVVAGDGGGGTVTRLTIITTGGDALVKGGDGGAGNPGGNGAAAIKVVDGARGGVKIDIGDGVTVRGGKGGNSTTGKGGDGGSGIEGDVGTNDGTIIGGDGGDSESGNGGNGGHGVDGNVDVNTGSITGGDGGDSDHGRAGDGGQGVTGNVGTNDGTISGGQGGETTDGTPGDDGKPVGGTISGGSGTVVKVKLAVPEVPSAEYTGEAVEPHVPSSALYAVSASAWTRPGSYPVVMTLLDAANYEWVPRDGATVNGLLAIVNFVIGEPLPHRFRVTFDANGGTVDAGEMEFDIGTCYGALPVPSKAGYLFDGWYENADFSGEPVTRNTEVIAQDLTLHAKWLRRALWYTDATFHLEGAATYDGYVIDPAAGDRVAGTIQVKAGKPNKKTGVSKLTVTVQLAGGKKTKLKGSTFDGVFAGNMGGRSLNLKLGYSSLAGTLDGYALDGARNVFAAKDADSKVVAAQALKQWQGTYVAAWEGASGWNGLSIDVKSKGKVKVSGTLADGTKVSANSQLLVGERECALAVSWTKKAASVACLVWFCEDGTVECMNADGAETLIANARDGAMLPSGAALRIDATAMSAVVPGLLTEILPDGVEVRMKGLKFDIDKAGKVSAKGGTMDLTKAGTNPAGLKLSYKIKDCTFKGAFSAYVLSGGKLTKVKVQVSGVVLRGKGYGTATVKGKGAVAITIE